ncbi:hypothetical protein DICSQDRAFT_24568, partial [Dichomitus squalens LYAD-421 SS1]
MSAINASTGFSRFQLHIGRQPRILPPILSADAQSVALDAPDETRLAENILSSIETDVFEAQDNLLAAKLAQITAANRGRSEDPPYAVGDLVLLSTFHRRRDYMRKGDNRVAK